MHHLLTIVPNISHPLTPLNLGIFRKMPFPKLFFYHFSPLASSLSKVIAHLQQTQKIIAILLRLRTTPVQLHSRR